MTQDSRIVYGARCTWWGTIAETSRAFAVPTCPHCQSVLYECRSITDWDALMDRTVARGYPLYKAAMDWQHSEGLHFKDWLELEAAYKLYLGRAQ